MSADRSTLLRYAKDLLERPTAATAGLWPRASALLARQALETSLDDLWKLRAPGLERCSVRAQLLCLPYVLSRDPELADRVSYAWAGLSRACHQHAYELPPALPELAGWIGVVEELEGKGLKSTRTA